MINRKLPRKELILVAYEPTQWKDGDVINAEKLNKMEQGINQASNDVLVVEFTDTGINATPNDIYNAYENNLHIIGKRTQSDGAYGESKVLVEIITYNIFHSSEGYYQFDCSYIPPGSTYITPMVLTASSETDYFAFDDNETG